MIFDCYASQAAASLLNKPHTLTACCVLSALEALSETIRPRVAVGPTHGPVSLQVRWTTPTGGRDYRATVVACDEFAS